MANRNDPVLPLSPRPHSHLDQSAEPDLSLADVLDVFVRRRILTLIVLVLFLLMGVLLSLRHRKYEAEGVIRIRPGSASQYRASAIGGISSNDSYKIASDVAILESRTLYLQVARELNLAQDPDFSGKSAKTSMDDPLVRETMYRRLKSAITVKQDPKDEIVTITCSTKSPALSAKIVNTLINDYVSYLFQTQFGSTQRSAGWLIGQLGDLKSQVEQDQTTITQLQKKLGIIGFDEKGGDYLVSQSLDSLTKASSEATIDRIVAEAKLRFLANSDPNLLEGSVNILGNGANTGEGGNGLLTNLRNSRATAASNYAKLLAQFGANYPEVKQQKAQLDELNREVAAEQKRVINQAQVSYQAASENERKTQQILSQQKNQAFDQHSDMVKYVLLLHDYESHRTLYEGLIQRLREASITSGLGAGEVDVVDLADLPVLPSPPGPVLLILGSLLAGILAACAAVFLREALDSRIMSQEEAERATRLPMLASLPHAGKGRTGEDALANPLDALKKSTSHYGEAMESLRTSLLLGNPDHPPKVFLIVSSMPNEGKSTTALNLAATLAKHEGNILLLEADLRRGKNARRVGISNLNGVSTILSGQATLDDAVHAVPDHPGLFMLPGGPVPPDPAVILSSRGMIDLVAKCRQRFDYVVIDSPPVLGLSDSLHLVQLVDAVILVVRESRSGKKAVRESVEILARSQKYVAGFVLNDIDTFSHAYGYGYGYRKYYGSYYADSKEETK
jgi:capsular exopolysaccharide synthesis family protein